MFNRIAAMLLALFALCAVPAAAQQTPTDKVIASLLANGYVILTEEITWLGRQRIVAENSTYRREIVFNPATGEIFRDYAFELRFAVKEVEHESRSSNRTVATGAAQVNEPPPLASDSPAPVVAETVTMPGVIFADPGLVTMDPEAFIISTPAN